MESSADRNYPDSYQFLLGCADGERLLLRSFYFICAPIQRRLHSTGFDNVEYSPEKDFSQFSFQTRRIPHHLHHVVPGIRSCWTQHDADIAAHYGVAVRTCNTGERVARTLLEIYPQMACCK